MHAANLPLAADQITFHLCCGKDICIGCVFAMDEREGVKQPSCYDLLLLLLLFPRERERVCVCVCGWLEVDKEED